MGAKFIINSTRIRSSHVDAINKKKPIIIVMMIILKFFFIDSHDNEWIEDLFKLGNID